MTTHSIFSPSSAWGWSVCPAWAHLRALYPDEPGDAALEGTRAHAVVEKVLRGKYTSDATEEMVSGAHKVLDFVRYATASGALHIEERVGGDATTAGTCDLWFISGNTLHVVDYKYGRMPVSPVHNHQLILYAMHILRQHDGIANVALTIVQPRGGDPIVKTHYMSPADVLREGERLESIARAPATTRDVGAQCRYCPDAARCKVLDEHNTASDIDGLTLTQLATRRDAMESQYQAAYDEALRQACDSGRAIDGWQLVERKGRLVWQDADTVAEQFPELTHPELCTPLQAIKKGLDEDVVKSHSVRAASTFQLKQTKEN